MASKKKHKGMLFRQEGAPSPEVAPAADKPLPCKGGMEQSTPLTSKGADNRSKQKMDRSRESTRKTSWQPAGSGPQSDNLPPDSVCKGVKVTLDNNSMWNEFFRCGTEMIVTKQGSRMFPYCRFRISGLQPSRKYSLIMDIQPADGFRHRWTGRTWLANGKAECHIKSQPFAHPESPATGQHWMQSPVSFYRLKLTNNMSDQEGNAVLHPMHRYLPRVHVIQTDRAAKDVKLSGPGVVTFTFPQTEFMAVTTYQNTRFAQLKVNYNPFAKGLKEDGSSPSGLKRKANSDKDSHRDEGTTTTEHHPVKKSLKSLLANHKRRTSTAGDSKLSEDLRKGSAPIKDPSAAKGSGESSCTSSHPAQKLFSELIREAHVSLHRCDLELLGISHSSNTVTLKGKGSGVGQKDKALVGRPTKKSETVVLNRKVKEDQHLLNSVNCEDDITMGCSGASGSQCSSHKSAEDLDHQRTPEPPPDVSVKQPRRPARLPLPALALFLKQHSTKKTKSKLDSSPLASASEYLSSASVSLLSDANGMGSTKDLSADVTKPNIQASRWSDADPHLDEVVLNVTRQTVEPAHRPLSLLCPSAAAEPEAPRTDEHLAFENPGPEPTAADGKPALLNSDQPRRTPGPTLATSSDSPTLSSPVTVLPSPNCPQTLTQPSTLPSDSPTLRSESLLPDPECSSFSFEPLSPASSPEALPALPASLAFELDSATSEAACTSEPPEDLPDATDSSVFKWHTVLPPPEQYIDSSFTTFQDPTQSLPLESVTPPLLPSQTPPCHPEPQTLNTSTLPPDPPSFQENEQVLPFPAELSPLVLQLPLSPTFSSLDGDGLSPTPSIADLVHFFSTDDDLGMGVEFSNTEAVAVPCPPPPAIEEHEPPRQEQPVLAGKSCKRKKKTRRRKPTKTDPNPKVDDSAYGSMQPNLEEVEEQLFISFTSKEALKLHLADSSEDPDPALPEVLDPAQAEGPDLPLPEDLDRAPPAGLQTAGEPENSTESRDETIAAFQKLLLRDLKLMRHRQVIHPVLQEVGLKMTLLDQTLTIDLQYLGVRLPIPLPGAGLELVSSQGASAAFVSRTGKTTDVTQIKGWREKFSPSESPSMPAPSRPEAGPGPELPKKNLSAFCSDMLDEYLENEGKLIDERAASFSQPPVEPPVYQLPTRSTSYVRTLDHITTKPTADSDLISGFIPPSKRPRLQETRTCGRAERKQRGPRQTRSRPEPIASPEPVPAKPVVPIPTGDTGLPPTFTKRRRFKPKTWSQTLGPSGSVAPPPGTSDHLAPLESDSELGPHSGQSEDGGRTAGRPLMTRALLRQKDLEDGVVWEGRPRTAITEERAAIALTSLFTLTGFVSENPMVPVQLSQRRPPLCLNEFCRLGCVCCGLSRGIRPAHCGRPGCMFGCSCLKQKVVLLKNLDGSDSSPTPHPGKRRRKRRRMKMAYILKEADSVSQPAERVRVLWTREARGSDPEPVHIPEAAPVSHPVDDGSCARVRGYQDKIQIPKETTKNVKSKPGRRKSLKEKNLFPKKTKAKTSCPPSGEADQLPPSSPLAEPTPKPSKRLFILAECQWASAADRSLVLQRLCEAMAQDRLDRPFWIRKYLISPLSQTVEGSGAERCIQYRIHISRPRVEQEKPGGKKDPEKIQPDQHRPQGDLGHVGGEAEPLEDWQQQVMEEAEPLEDWQREVEEDDIEEEEVFTGQRVDDGKERVGEKTTISTAMRSGEEKKTTMSVGMVMRSGEERKTTMSVGMAMRSGEERKTTMSVGMAIKSLGERMTTLGTALPFLTGISPAGFLSANKKQPGGTDHLVQVNGKFYPLAKIQLGKMGALHPANRLAAYLTGRVVSSRQQQASLAASCRPGASTGSSATAAMSARLPPAVAAAAVLTGNAGAQASRTSAPPIKLAPPRAPQVLMVQVSAPPPGVAPWPPKVPSAGARMVLQPVRTVSGVQYYRKPDGKLVQLFPISQLKPVNPNTPGQTGASSVLTATSFPTPPITMVDQRTSCLTTVTSSSSCSALSGSSRHPVIVAPPLPPISKVVRGPASITVFQPHPSLISLTPAAGQGAEPGVKTVAVSTGGVLDQHIQAPPQTSITPTPAGSEVTPEAPAGSEVTHSLTPPDERIRADLQLARDQLDLDLDGAAGRVPTPPVDVVEVTSSETEKLTDSEDEQRLDTDHQHRPHTVQERQRREQLLQRFNSLRTQLGPAGERASKVCTLRKAVQLIWELRSTEEHLKKKKRRLRMRRDAYLSTIAPSAGSMDKMIEVSSDEEKVVRATAANSEREKQGGPPTASRLPAVGGASDPPTEDSSDDDIVSYQLGSCDPQQGKQTPPTPAPVQMVPQVLTPVLAPPTVSHNAPVPWERPRTVPNILSRSKNPPPARLAKTEGGPPSFQALVPAEVLSLVTGALPGQQVLALSPLVAGPPVLPTSPGVAAVTLNIPSLTNQHVHLTSLPRPPNGKVNSSVAPPTATYATAAEFKNLLHLLHPEPHSQLIQAPPPPPQNQLIQAPPPPPHNQLIQAPSPPPHNQLIQAPLPPPHNQLIQTPPPPPHNQLIQTPPPPPHNQLIQTPPPPPHNQLIQAPPPTSQLIQAPPPPHSQLIQASPPTSHLIQAPPPPPHNQLIQAPLPPPHSQLIQAPPHPPHSQLVQAPPPPLSGGSDQNQDLSGPEARADPDNESLTSLLNEIVFLNQQTVTTVTTAVVSPSEGKVVVGGAVGRRHTHSLLGDAEGVGDNGHTDTMQQCPADGDTKGGVLAPPPLLQMKVGGAKVADPVSTAEAVTGGGVRRTRGGTWRPMPRLVPLGLRGAPPS